VLHYISCSFGIKSAGNVDRSSSEEGPRMRLAKTRAANERVPSGFRIDADAFPRYRRGRPTGSLIDIEARE